VTIRGSLDITAADSEGSAEPLSGSVGIYEAAAITIPENGIFTANGIEKAVKGTGTGIDFQSGAIVQLDRAEIVTASPDIIISSGAVNYLQPDGAAPVNDYGDKVYPFDLQKYTGTGFQLYSKIGGTDYLYKVSSEEGGTIVWAPKAVITFMADDKVSGTCETMAGMTAGFSETSLPADPAKDGYVFEGWFRRRRTVQSFGNEGRRGADGIREVHKDCGTGAGTVLRQYGRNRYDGRNHNGDAVHRNTERSADAASDHFRTRRCSCSCGGHRQEKRDREISDGREPA